MVGCQSPSICVASSSPGHGGHTWASLALQQGVPLKVVSERLGHSSISITADTYQHVTEGMDRDAADRVAQVLFR
ncbi:MAG: tyrosine-type recombinase/integrase [Acidimicrobiia bacterium]